MLHFRTDCIQYVIEINDNLDDRILVSYLLALSRKNYTYGLKCANLCVWNHTYSNGWESTPTCCLYRWLFNIDLWNWFLCLTNKAENVTV